MSTPTPVTTANEISVGISAIMVGLRRYLEHEEFVHKRLSREIDKLMVIDAGAAWSLKAMYCTAFGKADEAIYASETAMRNNISTPQMGNLLVEPANPVQGDGPFLVVGDHVVVRDFVGWALPTVGRRVIGDKPVIGRMQRWAVPTLQE